MDKFIKYAPLIGLLIAGIGAYYQYKQYVEAKAAKDYLNQMMPQGDAGQAPAQQDQAFYQDTPL